MASSLKEESAKLKGRLQTLLPKNLNLGKANANKAAAEVAARGAKVAFSPEEMLAPAITRYWVLPSLLLLLLCVQLLYKTTSKKNN